MNRLPFPEMAIRLEGLVTGKKLWLRDHSSKRPEYEVKQRERELEALEQAVADYRRAAERKETV